MPRPPIRPLRRAAALAAIALLPLAGCAKRKPPPPPWESIPLGTDAGVSDLWFADSLNGWLVGGSYKIEGGLVGRTHDGGRTWSFTSGFATPDPGASGFDLLAVRFLDARRGIMAGNAGKVFVTDDGGDNWRLVRYGRGLVDHISSFEFLDSNYGWAAGVLGVIRTRDGGETWEDVSRTHPDIEPPIVHAIHFFDARNGLMVGRDGVIMRTGDGGETWDRVPTPLAPDERPFLYDLFFLDPQNGWAVGAEGTVLHTNDGGWSWHRQETGVEGARSKSVREVIRRRAGVFDTLDLGERTPGLTLTAVRFVDTQRGWMTGNFGYEGRSILLSTTDGGESWTVDQQVPGEVLATLFVLDAEHAWAVGTRGRPGVQMLLRRTPASIAAAATARR